MKNYNGSVVERNDETDPTTQNDDLNAGILKKVTVRIASLPTSGQGAKADLFGINDAPIANPLLTDNNGNYVFRAADGFYDIIIEEGVLDVIEPSVELSSGRVETINIETDALTIDSTSQGVMYNVSDTTGSVTITVNSVPTSSNDIIAFVFADTDSPITFTEGTATIDTLDTLTMLGRNATVAIMYKSETKCLISGDLEP